MADLFTQEWAETFASRWNRDPEMVAPLSANGFSAVIAFGYADTTSPLITIEVSNGRVARVGSYQANAYPSIDWDLRASPAQWNAWKQKPLEITGVSLAVNKGDLQFKAGDYRKLMRTPEMAAAFLRFFTLL